MKIIERIGPALLLAAAAVSPASASAYNMQIVFGDSLSDSGNVFNVSSNFGISFPPSPPYNQRATNGLTAVEHLAHDYLGYDLKPSVPSSGGTPGTNFAYLGATTGYYTVSSKTDGSPLTTSNYNDWARGLFYLRDTGLPGQVTQFLAAPPKFDPATTLFTVFAGSNDVFLAVEAGGSKPDLSSIPGNLASAVTDLVQGGARKLLVPNIPNLGLTPEALASGDVGSKLLSKLSADLNLGIDLALSALESGLGLLYPDVDIIPFDTYAAFNDLVRNPPPGITNTTQACLSTTTFIPCANPDQYVFWDGVHPTDVTHRLLAARFAAALGIPEPQSYALLALGSALLFAVRRHRRGRD